MDSRATNIWAWVSATGATSAALSASARKKRPTPVFGEARLRATGTRRVDQGAELAEGHVQVGPAAGQRVAELDQVCRERPARVGGSKMLKNWSISTGSGWATLSGRVEPSA